MFKKEGFAQHPALSRDLATDKFLMWLDRGPRSAIPWLSTALLCFMLGGMSGLIWGAAVRTVFVWHATWCVNSVCHRFGQRPHDTRESSGNVWWVGLWALGEGWHNNHHANPRAALHNYHWWEIDLSGYTLRLLERTRLIHKVIRAGRQKTGARA
jgi:stearoyl-CoA desaturase (delta-9 desaturase)